MEDKRKFILWADSELKKKNFQLGKRIKQQDTTIRELEI